MAEKTEAQKRAQKAYMKTRATIQLVMTVERRENIKSCAAAAGESVNAFINEAIDQRMIRENAQ